MPLVVNVVEGGRTPQLDLEEYPDLGFGVVLYANYLMRSMMAAGSEALAHLAEQAETAAVQPMATWERAPGAVQPAPVHCSRGGARPAGGRQTRMHPGLRLP